jgi:hypothetical protein
MHSDRVLHRRLQEFVFVIGTQRERTIHFAREFTELRARVARARQCAQQGKGQKALDILSPIYDWFSQGFGTPDLLQAKTLLDELR